MKLPEKRRSIFTALMVGVLIAPGFVLLGWRFRIFSYSRLAETSLYVMPVSVLVLFFLQRLVRIRLHDVLNRRSLLNLAVSIAVSLIVTPYPDDLIRYGVTLALLSIFFFFAGLSLLGLHASGKKKWLNRLYDDVFFAAGLIGLLLFLYMAIYVRLYADDFCFTNAVRSDGFLPTLVNFYQSWSGRVFSDLFMFGFSSTQIMPLIEIVSLVLMTYLCFHMLREETNQRFSLWAASAALLIAFVVFATIPDPYKSLYWITNTELIFPVSIVMILFVFFMLRGLFKGFRQTWFSIWAAFGMSMAIATGHEILVPALMLFIGLCLVYSFYQCKKDGSRTAILVVTSSLVGAVAGTLIVVLAPGNYVRMAAQGYPPTPDLFAAIGMSAQYFFDFLVRLMKNGQWMLFLAVFAAGVNSRTLLPRNWTFFSVVFIFAPGAAWGTFLISAFAMSDVLPTRTQFVPVLILTLGLFVLGAVLPRSKPHAALSHLAAIALLLFIPALTQVIVEKTKLVTPMVQFANDWDERDRALRLSNIEPYMIDIPWDYEEQSFHCMEEYYSRSQPGKDAGE